MARGPVELHDEPGLPPHAVGLDPPAPVLEPQVDLRAGQAGAVDEGEEAILQLAARDPRTDRLGREDRAQRGRAGPAGMAGEQVHEGERAIQPEHRRLLDRPLERPRPHDGREVEQRPRRRRDRMPSSTVASAAGSASRWTWIPDRE